MEDLSITLKNIDLTGITISDEMVKVAEEDSELDKALLEYCCNNTKDTKDHVIEEYWDTVQARLGLLQKCGINAHEIMQGYYKHLVKLKDRPRVKGE
ncbi:UNVERIFIED_ORG: hypothetical protein B2H98_05380 [Clostridium botulinum]|uniref:hypothetical protein n=1 Tax=Clostridium botulinum TaxID=1491 RepID=UPI000A16E35E|nr:hypothetical protein [Clostridium botulinum]MBY6789229.1 hypothetical protein [Clostridium botulinum]MBY6946578.1 hypothetical protein [Clostridium botulinum]MBY7020206.1 hypothetical protein [Clostridium botulinum]NFI33203.1 hypothetical protein [Clostridium botulinum]